MKKKKYNIERLYKLKLKTIWSLEQDMYVLKINIFMFLKRGIIIDSTKIL